MQNDIPDKGNVAATGEDVMETNKKLEREAKIQAKAITRAVLEVEEEALKEVVLSEDGEGKPPANHSGDNPPRNIGSSPDLTSSTVPPSTNNVRKYARDICRTAEFFYKSYEESVDYFSAVLAPTELISPNPVSIDALGDLLDKLAMRGFSGELRK